MGQIVTVPKIGTGSDYDTYTADLSGYEYKRWEIVEESETTFTIRIFN